VEARRNQIVDAAWACFARKGYHQTTMQDIASEAGISAGAIYRYYPSKEGVLKAINDRSQELGRALVEWARSHGAGGPTGTLGVIGRAMLSVFANPEFETMTRVNIEVWPEVIRSDTLRNAIRTELSFWRTVVAELLAGAAARGELREGVDPQAAAVLLISAYEGLRHYWLLDPENFTPERLIAAAGGLFTTDLQINVEALVDAAPGLAPPLGIEVRRSGTRDDDVRPAGDGPPGGNR
jgi:AcrR family transcriptional regulator